MNFLEPAAFIEINWDEDFNMEVQGLLKRRTKRRKQNPKSR